MMHQERESTCTLAPTFCPFFVPALFWEAPIASLSLSSLARSENMTACSWLGLQFSLTSCQAAVRVLISASSSLISFCIQSAQVLNPGARAADLASSSSRSNLRSRISDLNFDRAIFVSLAYTSSLIFLQLAFALLNSSSDLLTVFSQLPFLAWYSASTRSYSPRSCLRRSSSGCTTVFFSAISEVSFSAMRFSSSSDLSAELEDYILPPSMPLPSGERNFAYRSLSASSRLQVRRRVYNSPFRSSYSSMFRLYIVRFSFISSAYLRQSSRLPPRLFLPSTSSFFRISFSSVSSSSSFRFSSSIFFSLFLSTMAACCLQMASLSSLALSLATFSSRMVTARRMLFRLASRVISSFWVIGGSASSFSIWPSFFCRSDSSMLSRLLRQSLFFLTSALVAASICSGVLLGEMDLRLSFRACCALSRVDSAASSCSFWLQSLFSRLDSSSCSLRRLEVSARSSWNMGLAECLLRMTLTLATNCSRSASSCLLTLMSSAGFMFSLESSSFCSQMTSNSACFSLNCSWSFLISGSPRYSPGTSIMVMNLATQAALRCSSKSRRTQKRMGLMTLRSPLSSLVLQSWSKAQGYCSALSMKLNLCTISSGADSRMLSWKSESSCLKTRTSSSPISTVFISSRVTSVQSSLKGFSFSRDTTSRSSYRPTLTPFIQMIYPLTQCNAPFRHRPGRVSLRPRTCSSTPCTLPMHSSTTRPTTSVQSYDLPPLSTSTTSLQLFTTTLSEDAITSSSRLLGPRKIDRSWS